MDAWDTLFYLIGSLSLVPGVRLALARTARARWITIGLALLIPSALLIAFLVWEAFTRKTTTSADNFIFLFVLTNIVGFVAVAVGATLGWSITYLILTLQKRTRK